MRIVCVALILLVSSVPGYAQTQAGGQIRGTVRDSVGLPMPGVDVVVTDASASERRATTSADGTFALNGLSPGPYTVAARREGFLQWSGTVTLGAGAPVSLTIEMRPGYAETVIVTASRAQESLIGAPAAVTVVGRRKIETAAADNLGDLLKNVPGLNVTQFGARDINISLRTSTGVLSNSTLVMVDGRSF
ncbi:MAG: carboxypeptidase regulatory-like domain-containing protein, partial [Vicinamibacterales bacterium]